jgi:hypothetical protein
LPLDDFVANVWRSLLTVDKDALLELCGSVTPNQLKDVDVGLRMVLGL